MRMLHVPQIVTSHVASESDVYDHLCIRAATAEFCKSFHYFWLRRGDEGKFNEQDNLVPLFEDIPQLGFYAQMAAVDLRRMVELFSWQKGCYPVDVIWTSRAGIAALLPLALGDAAGQYMPPVVITEPRVYGPGEEGHNLADPRQLAVRAAGYATCFGLYWSSWEKEGALSAAEMYCKPGVLKEWDERSFVVDALVGLDEAYLEAKRRDDRKRVVFAGRLNSNKKWREVVDAYAKVLMSRDAGDVEVWVHAGTGAFGKIGDPKMHRWHKTSEKLPREEYWKLLGSSHVGAYWSHDEGANVTVQEMILAGVVMILPRRDWVRRLFWPHRYPFVVDKMSELPAVIDWVLDHYEEASNKLEDIRAMIQRERSWEPFVRKFGRLFEAVSKVPKPAPYRTFRRILQKVANGRTAVPFSQMLMATGSWRVSGPSLSEVRSMMACYQSVRDLDDMSGPDPILRVEEGGGEGK